MSNSTKDDFASFRLEQNKLHAILRCCFPRPRIIITRGQKTSDFEGGFLTALLTVLLRLLWLPTKKSKYTYTKYIFISARCAQNRTRFCVQHIKATYHYKPKSHKPEFQ